MVQKNILLHCHYAKFELFFQIGSLSLNKTSERHQIIVYGPSFFMFEGPHDVRIRMKAVGICGSDVHYLKTMRCADFIVKEPMVIGHECAGLI
ncbi:unnamed protein product, partial [Trifolium pratense]